MSLRTRLVAAFTVLLVAVITVAGFAAARSTRNVLTDQIDETLRGVATRIELTKDKGSGSLFDLDAVKTEDEEVRETEEQRPVNKAEAILVIDQDGVAIKTGPSGFSDDPDPLPDATATAALAASGAIATIPSTDGSMNYRAIAFEGDDGGLVLWAMPQDEVDAAVGDIIRFVFVTGTVLAAIGALITWWTVRRELRPVDQMVDTAAAIAAGDFAKRVPDEGATSELGKLTSALNEMLTQIEDAFAQEQAAKDRLKQFVADASHELRTPTTAIQGYSELYRTGALETEESIDKAMRSIAAETSRIQRLIDDLLMLARVDEEQTVERRPVNLAAIVRDAAIDSEAIEPDRPITVRGPDTVRVVGDEHLLTQIVGNLLANARQHTPKGSPVTLEVRQANGSVTLDVIDDGPGLPDDRADELFERFARLDNSRARRSGGAGLGLAIVAAIAEAHGGTVAAANEPGHGARFTVTLPAGT